MQITWYVHEIRVIRITAGPMHANCYLIFRTGDGDVVIIDPVGDVQKIVEEIEKTNVAPGVIINTHIDPSRFDTIKELAKRYNISSYDFSDLNRSRIIPVGECWLNIVHTPGYTPDSFCLFWSSVASDFVFVGEVFSCGGIGRTDLPGGSDEEMAASLKKLDELIPDKAKIYPGHGPSFIYEKGELLRWLRMKNDLKKLNKN